MSAPARPRDERGETLVELLVTVAILGIAGVLVVGAMLMGVTASDVGRKQASGGAYARSYAEAIQQSVDANAGYAGCGSAAATYGAVAVPDLPAGFTKSVVDVRSWTGSAWGACDSRGIQRITVRVVTTGDAKHRATEELTVVLRQPCNASGATPCVG